MRDLGNCEKCKKNDVMAFYIKDPGKFCASSRGNTEGMYGQKG